MKVEVWPKVNRCDLIIKSKDGNKRRGLLFKTANQLREHRVLLEHKRMRKTKKSSLKNQEKELRIDEVLATKQKEVPVKKINLPEEESEEETDAEEEKCMICKNTYFFIEMTCTLCIREISV